LFPGVNAGAMIAGANNGRERPWGKDAEIVVVDALSADRAAQLER
jgi:hypothetical protein